MAQFSKLAVKEMGSKGQGTVAYAYRVDEKGRLSSVMHEGARVTEYRFDGEGNVLQVVEANERKREAA
jgi:YD repeat-containing protein